MTDANFTQLTESQIDEIAERAAEKAVAKLTEQVYREVGKNVVQKFVYVVGASSIALFLWLQSKGLIK
ncbi:hypothetical protein [Hydrogenophaga sp.]|uniref:hypothetical protein n=1 Tax=Hydrogenophaga sp. TaxID=1904254 RepID=UPI0035B35EC0